MEHSLHLRPFADTDLPLYRQWLYAPHVAKWYHHPLSWLEEVAGRKGEFSFITHLIMEEYDHPVGFCQYYPYAKSGEDWQGKTPLPGTYSIDYLIGNPENLGRGLGKAIINTLVEAVSALPDSERIIVQPEEENLPSCNTLLACGFHYEEDGRYFRRDF